MLLENKKALVTGVVSKRSIAYAIAQGFLQQGAEVALSYPGEGVRERVEELARDLGIKHVFSCDVGRDDEVKRLFSDLKTLWGKLDILVHAIAYAPQEALKGDFTEVTSREAFAAALDISAYSIVALSREAKALMHEGGSVLTLTYLGSERVVPSYNVMGVAKAGLEACVRYLAASLGPVGIRVNAISAGPIRTPASSAISGFTKMLDFQARTAPLRRNVTQEDVARASLFLASDWAQAITGEVLFVDAGFHILAPTVEK